MVAGNAVLDRLEEQKLFDRIAPAGRAIMAALHPVRAHANVSGIRGLGLLVGIEFVKNKLTGEPFPRDWNVAERVREAAKNLNNTAGVLTYPGQGCVDGLQGDHPQLAPPFIIAREECDCPA